jgi:hypothetical protein
MSVQYVSDVILAHGFYVSHPSRTDVAVSTAATIATLPEGVQDVVGQLVGQIR